ncbi:hypothetical protein CCACVL1_22720 [Corchorus capsularis]|uniref:Uncharacterized protein n=1 Tax=Corchorus capsularis TaxID=210143 RepID=A0A1R3GWX9_COCAP|nr:hypothetical protein CCACVL1_22720 [Corchorus capsularis]
MAGNLNKHRAGFQSIPVIGNISASLGPN